MSSHTCHLRLTSKTGRQLVLITPPGACGGVYRLPIIANRHKVGITFEQLFAWCLGDNQGQSLLAMCFRYMVVYIWLKEASEV